MARVLAVMFALALLACGGAPKKKPGGGGGGGGTVQHGLASWYGGKHHGGPTASGERFNKHALTAAHKKLRMHTKVRVTNKRNGRTVVVRINDRGPYVKGRIIDLSERAAQILGMIDAGVVPVKIELLR
jgi:rare lipoprotein A